MVTKTEGTTRILVVDSNERFIEKVTEILAGIETTVLDVKDGEALSLVQSAKPVAALINADYSGPSTGLELCQQVKALRQSMPVVLMFDREETSCDERAAKCGADNYLMRPIKTKELLFAVRSMLRLERLLADGEAAQRLTGEDAEDGKTSSLASLSVFMRFLELEIQRSCRYGFPLAVLSVGSDPLPDEVPENWARTLKQQLGQALGVTVSRTIRGIDLCTAITTHEMAVLMPHTDAEGAASAAERICEAVATQPYHFGRTRIQPTVSVGVGVVHGDKIAPGELLSSAQSRRMQATLTGGNHVRS
ncbi:MAG: diguanylate cyclase [Deltaproteobacteria bacterium]|nr:diguanylate cyclase [Deltaproteobacteria bacterium]